MRVLRWLSGCLVEDHGHRPVRLAASLDRRGGGAPFLSTRGNDGLLVPLEGTDAGRMFAAVHVLRDAVESIPVGPSMNGSPAEKIQIVYEDGTVETAMPGAIEALRDAQNALL